MNVETELEVNVDITSNT